MRNYMVPLLVFCLAVMALSYSCKTKDESTAHSSFAISGVANVTVEQDTSITIPLSVTQVSGQAYAVSLSVAGLPPGVTASFSQVSGTPPFSTNFKITTANASVGTYTLKLIGGSSQSSNDYSFDLTVKATPDCIDPSFLGNKQGHDYCTSTQNVYGVYIIKDTTRANRIFIMNFGDFGTMSQVYADINCNSKSITIPSQIIPGNLEITGTGSFTTSPTKLTVSYHTTNGSFNEYCSTTIQ